MSDETRDDLNRILTRHRERVAAMRAAAEAKAHGYADARTFCGDRLRAVAMPLLRDWSKRLSVEGYPTSVEDRLGCHPPSLVLRLAPHGAPESAFALACRTGGIIQFRSTVAGKEVGGEIETPLVSLEAPVLLEGLSRFVASALEATLVEP